MRWVSTMYTARQKKNTSPNFCTYIGKILTDFKNSFTVTLCGKFWSMWIRYRDCRLPSRSTRAPCSFSFTWWLLRLRRPMELRFSVVKISRFTILPVFKILTKSAWCCRRQNIANCAYFSIQLEHNKYTSSTFVAALDPGTHISFLFASCRYPSIFVISLLNN